VFEWMLTMLSTEVDLDLVAVTPSGGPGHEENGHAALDRDQQRALQLGRKLKILAQEPQTGPDIVRMAREGNYNVLIVPWSEEKRTTTEPIETDWVHYVLQNSPCSVFLASHPVIPKEVVA
jgi:hypothetical protein